jgi:hypothetical protein
MQIKIITLFILFSSFAISQEKAKAPEAGTSKKGPSKEQVEKLLDQVDKKEERKAAKKKEEEIKKTLEKARAMKVSQETPKTNEEVKSDKTQLEKEMETVNFGTLKEVLKEDKLKPIIIKKKNKIKVIKKVRKVDHSKKYNMPTEQEFWKIASELWLVKNAALINWDITKPDYGIETSFRRLLETVGYFEKTFHLLLVNNPEITHFSLPTNHNEYILILSVPFIRAMDLSKLEISLLLLEDVFRTERKYFIKNLNADLSWLGGNFYKKKFPKQQINNLLVKYSDVVLKKGFSFQQQYEVTKRMDLVLKSFPNLWNTYLKLLLKIDDLVKGNILFKNYLKIYPSPEMQIKWFTPTKS